MGSPVPAAGVRSTDVVWAVGRVTLGTVVRFVAPLRVYGADRVPKHGGVVLALNHFSWLDPAVFGTACPRTIYYMAKIEAHGLPGLGQVIRAFGTFSVRRGESDREAVRMMREVVRDGRVLGLFAEGTRQRSGVPGEVKPGAAMVALQEGVPVVPAAVHGSQSWRVGGFQPVSVAWGEPMRFHGLPRNAKGYREASAEIQAEIRRLWDFLVAAHELGRPKEAVPPRLAVHEPHPAS
jgi:1-acyl-sn-glycerol-3-phosphate acyltransferase